MSVFFWTALSALIIRVQIPTPTPVSTPAPVSVDDVTQYLNQSIEVIRVYQETNITLAFVGFLILATIAVIVWMVINRRRVDAREAAFVTLSNIVVKQDARLERAENKADKAKEDNDKLDTKYLDTFMAVGEQLHTMADIAKRHEQAEAEQRATNKRIADVLEGMYQSDTQIKTTLDTIAKDGSQPLRDLAASLKNVFEWIEEINKRSSDWDKVISLVPDVKLSLANMQGTIDELATRAQIEKKRSSQPLPKVEVTTGESIEVSAVEND